MPILGTRAPQPVRGRAPAAPPTTLRGALNTPKIVLLVMAAAAPLAAVVGTVPLAFALGNGVGVPGTFVVAGVVLLCFSVGYAAMSRRIVNTGGFYTYLAMGFGRPIAVGAGLVAVIAYNAAAIGLVGAFGYFTHITAAQHGLNLPWEAWAGICLLLIGVLGYRRIDLSVAVLSVLMVAEVGVLAVLDVAVIARRGLHALPMVSMSPEAVFDGAVGATMMFAFMSFIGFESAALYGEEAKNPKRSVPLATYSSVVVISAFYALTSWAAVGGIGPQRLQQVADHQSGDLFFQLGTTYVSASLATVMQIFLCTSLLAATLALHNAANRYTFVLSRDGLLPTWLAQAHPRHRSPHRAGVVHVVIGAVVVGGYAAAGLDPYTNLATSMLGLGTLGIVVLQAAAAWAVISFFRGRADRHWWRTTLAPALGGIGLLAATVLLVHNYALLTGTANPIINASPWLLVVATVAGIGVAIWVRSHHPERYAALGQAEIRAVDTAGVDGGGSTRTAVPLSSS